ncbi:MAG: ABC transporter substrate-binding protein [Coriobacteriia bacterium]|nr:ABC transporter substrate-binding protein [Coriobacteriia bacterium]
MSKSITRRGFVGATAAAVAGIAALSGCSNSSSSSSNTPANNTNTNANTAAPTIELNDEVESLVVVVNPKDTKTSSISLANAKGYYTEEKLTVTQEPFGGGFPEIMPGLSKGSIDVVPYGSIPTCTYVAQGDDLVIFGGTVMDGSEAVVRAEDKDRFKKADDFKGAKIACFRMETGHMATKSWLRKQGLKIGALAEGNDVEFILLEGSAAEVEAVKKGECDIAFVNSGYGFVAIQDPSVVIGFRPNELMGHEFPCCRQSTNRAAFEEKKSALVKFEIANLRALCDINTDKAGTIQAISGTSGQSAEYVEATMYSTATYTAAMKFEMDPMTDDVKAFYEDMVDNGDLADNDKSVILDHMDSTIYKAALDELIKRGENKSFYEGLLEEYTAHNTLGL